MLGNSSLMGSTRNNDNPMRALVGLVEPFVKVVQLAVNDPCFLQDDSNVRRFDELRDQFPHSVPEAKQLVESMRSRIERLFEEAVVELPRVLSAADEVSRYLMKCLDSKLNPVVPFFENSPLRQKFVRERKVELSRGPGNCDAEKTQAFSVQKAISCLSLVTKWCRPISGNMPLAYFSPYLPVEMLRKLERLGSRNVHNRDTCDSTCRRSRSALATIRSIEELWVAEAVEAQQDESLVRSFYHELICASEALGNGVYSKTEFSAQKISALKRAGVDIAGTVYVTRMYLFQACCKSYIGPPVRFRPGLRLPTVLGYPSPRMSDTALRLVRALVDAHQRELSAWRGLSKSELNEIARSKYAIRTLTQLAEQHPASWGRVISKPGVRGNGGYRIAWPPLPSERPSNTSLSSLEPSKLPAYA